MNKNGDVFEFVKNTWFLPAIILLLLALVVAKKFDFSFTDYLANKVIHTLEADYSPYGPSVPGQTPPVAQPLEQSQPPTNSDPPPWVRPPR